MTRSALPATPKFEIEIDADQLSSVLAHLEGCYPEEGCGLLLGVWGQQTTVVRAVICTPNAWPVTAERRTRYEIAPQQIAQADRFATAQGWDIVGVFHSHPEHAATPSAFDASGAWPDLSYVIVSVQSRYIFSISSHRISQDTAIFALETLNIKNSEKLHARWRALV
jgi:proteasome lid subunit RPN8/RPN11